MSCPRLPDAWEAATDPELAGSARDELHAHARRCAECAEALGWIERLREAEDPAAARDPGPVYWDAFGRRLARRIEEEGSARTGARGWSWRGRVALGAAAAVLLAAALVVVDLGHREPDGSRSSASSADVNAARGVEDLLLRRLGEATPDHVDEALDRYLPVGAEDWSEDLAGLMGPSTHPLDEDLGTRPDADSVYDLFLELPEEARGRFLKEMRGEIGGSGRS